MGMMGDTPTLDTPASAKPAPVAAGGGSGGGSSSAGGVSGGDAGGVAYDDRSREDAPALDCGATAIFHENSKALSDAVRRTGIDPIPSSSGYFLLADCSAVRDDDGFPPRCSCHE
jgi:hypothetical protein